MAALSWLMNLGFGGGAATPDCNVYLRVAVSDAAYVWAPLLNKQSADVYLLGEMC